MHRGHLCLASARPTHCGRGAQHRPAHRATHLPMCHFAAHHTQKNTLIEFTVKNPSPGHIERWGGRATRGLSKPIPAVQLDTYAASGAKFGPRWTSSSYPTNLTNLSTTPRPPVPIEYKVNQDCHFVGPTFGNKQTLSCRNNPQHLVTNKQYRAIFHRMNLVPLRAYFSNWYA